MTNMDGSLCCARLAARLAHMPRDKLLTICEKMMRENEAARQLGDAAIAEAMPMPQWVTAAMLSHDILILVFQHLRLHRTPEVGGVCHLWRDLWKELVRPLSTVKTFANSGGLQLGYPSHVVAWRGGGVLVPDFGNCCLKRVTLQDAHAQVEVLCLENRDGGTGLNTPCSVALLDDGTAWVQSQTMSYLIKVRLSDGENLITMWEYDDEMRSWFDTPAPYLIDLARAGDSILLLSHYQTSRIPVIDARTGALQRILVLRGIGPEGLRGASSIAVDGDFAYVADTHNQRVVVFNHLTGDVVRKIGKTGTAPYHDDEDDDDFGPYWFSDDYDDERIGSAPGEFDRPFDVAIGHGRLYVSEMGRRFGSPRIQVLTLEGEPLQVLRSPNGKEVQGLCVDGDHVWCIGPQSEPSCMHLLTTL